jgi:sec-independent protein translocase protein TatB
MFDLGWIELLTIAIVAVLVVGPKDLPAMMRTFGRTVGRMKRLAGQFQSQFNEALREAEIDDVRKTVEKLGNPVADIRRELQSADKIGREIKDELTKTGAPAPSGETPAAKAAAPAPDQPVMRPIEPAVQPDGPAAPEPKPAVADGNP